MKASKQTIDKRNECGILNMSSPEMIPLRKYDRQKFAN